MELVGTFGHILHGFAVSAEPHNLLFLVIGVVLGTLIGLLPGIGSSTAIALLLPVTYGMSPVAALIMFAGIYYGAQYGNTASAVLINTPGTASAAMTTLDGYPMAKAGRAGAALAAATIASFVSGTASIILLTVLAIPFARFALDFGPAEYFALTLFALSAVSSLTGRSVPKGILAALLGLMISTVGIDLQSGVPRFTMGVLAFQDGISFLIVIVGFFAIAEIMINVERWFHGSLEPIPIKGKLWLTREEWRRCIKPIIRGCLIGFGVGVLPGTGGTVATVLAYATERRLAKQPERFGKGAIEGVASPEAANNASTCGAMVPMLTLGVPGSDTTAVMLGALVLYGIVPGPHLFVDQPDLVWGLVNSMYLGNVVLVILNLPLIGILVRILRTPPGILMALILAVASVGTYSLDNSTTDLFAMLFFGLVGYGFRKLDIPVSPLILGLVLGSLMEQSFRQSMVISSGNPIIFFSSWTAATLMVMAIVSLLAPTVGRLLKRLFNAARQPS